MQSCNGAALTVVVNMTAYYLLYSDGSYISKWLMFICNTLCQNEFGNIWFNQGHGINYKQFKVELSERLKLQYDQQWRNTLNNSSKAVLYRELQTVFEIEQYIIKYPWNTVRYILKFRTSNHKLAVEKGRYNNIERNQRYCDICKQNLLGDEYHLFF